jgi:hypothetical protein
MAGSGMNSVAREFSAKWPARLALVWSVTFAGGLLGLVGARLHSWPLLFSSLALDVVDGKLARFFDVASERGGLFDWTVDAGIAGAILMQLPPARHTRAVHARFLARARAGRPPPRSGDHEDDRVEGFKHMDPEP